jgi:hypothetical protein
MNEPTPAGIVSDAIWSSVVSKYDLRPDELVTLEDICRLSDMIDNLETVWRDNQAPLVTTGSMGQEVTHPLVSEIKAHRMARNALWRQLKLPDLPTAGEKPQPNQQRAAAQTRWSPNGATG